MKHNKEKYILIGIFILAIFLRFYRLLPNLIFNGEMGTDYMNVWNMLHGARSWLIGPSTSHEWFSIAPLAYWIYGVVLLIGKWNPISINFFWEIISVLALPVSYFYIRKLFDSKIALISVVLMAVSPALINQARDARYNLVVSYLFLPYFYYLVKSLKDKGKSLLPLGIILGLMMSFFPSPLLLIPAMVVSFLFFKVKPRFKYVLNFVIGFLIPNVTFLIYEIGNKFEITTKLLSWIPYRILGFFGLYQRNTVNSEVVGQNILSAYKYFGKVFGIENNLISIFILIAIVVGAVFFIKNNIKRKNENIPLFVLIINIFIFYSGLFVHGNPPGHYYYTIYLIPIILASYFINNLSKFKTIQYLLIALFIVIGVSNLISSKYYFTDLRPINYETNVVPYSLQVKIADSIEKDSKGGRFSIARVGVNDKFINNFANNYIYLLIAKGAKVDQSSTNVYTIVEGIKNNDSHLGKIIFSEQEVFVYKNII